METIKQWRLQDQVVIRRPLLNGRGSQVIKVGTILAFSDNGLKAVVSFPADQTRLTIPVDELQPAKALYARDRVHLDPTRRQVGWLGR